jgi:mannitol/fructose-specific phosphotransferase system IIA component (Ntr-type)
MKLADHLTPNLINLDLKSSTKEHILQELVWMLEVNEEHKPILLDMVMQRERLGSTGLGGSVAIPHGRSVIVDRLHLVFGVSNKGIYFKALDKKKVFLFFLVIAPHREVANQYLPLLGSIAKLASNPENVEALRKAKTHQEFSKILAGMDV